MKKILFLALILMSLAGCKKDKDNPAPELSARIAGTYKAIKLTYGGIDIPLTAASQSELTITVDKSGADAITGKIKIKLEGQVTEDTFGPLNLKDSGDGGVDIYESSQKVGNISKTHLMNITSEEDGVEMNIIAQRQ
ncbi:hypothetical protein GCM10023091_19770 [Ravibacter arvi]|uniref:Lipocalin-like domain-containing protein n=1 Tax=Ravibacter arvi TaxID=2051041 RepID=A0ABP8LWH0_9BACT